MATRSRTALYCKYRDAHRTHRKTAPKPLTSNDEKINRKLIDPPVWSDDEGDPRVYSVPPVWVVTVQDLKRDVLLIQSKIQELNEVSGKHLLPGFGEEEDHEETIARTVQEITSLFKECEKRLKEIASAKHEGTGDEQAVRKNIEQRVAKQLQDLSIEFRRGHKQYLAKLKGQSIEEYKPDLRSSSPTGSRPGGGGGGGGFFDDDEGAAPVDPRFNSQQTLQLVMAEQMSEERSKAIEQVAESVGELAGIFKEIQVLVIDQGTILDRIDFNIEMAADKVVAATAEIDKANQYQKKSRTMLCIYLLLLLCVAMVIVLILKKSMASR